MKNFRTKFFLPFFYHIILSVGLILLCIYLIVAEQSGIPGSLATEEEFSQEMQIDVSEPAQLNINQVEIEQIDNVALKIDQFFLKHKAPLAGYGAVFTEEARKNEIDPTIVAAIGWCESNGGKVTPQFGGQESYNAWGYAVYDSNSTTKKVNGYNMISWENGIAILSRYIRKNYDRGLIEPEEIVTRYTPASVQKANGDATKAPWTLCVKGTIEKILNEELLLADSTEPTTYIPETQ